MAAPASREPAKGGREMV